MSTRITFDLDGRKVFWDVDDNFAAILLQNFVQSLGPAQEVTE